MAFTSTSLMRPPPASDASSAGSPILMPKLQFRFRVIFDGFGAGAGSTESLELTKQVMDISRPSVSFPEIPLELYNSRVYLAGKPTWEAVSLNVRDDASGAVAKQVGNQLQKQFDFTEQASAAAGVDYKFNMRCQILDGGNGTFEPTVLEEWNLLGCYLASANYNTLNYGANEAVTIALSIRFDNAVQTDNSTSGAGVGGIGHKIGQAAGTAIGGL